MVARRLLFGGLGGGVRAWQRGSLSADGTPVTILADGVINSQPGIAWLDEKGTHGVGDRALVTFLRSSGLYGLILTCTGSWTFTAGSVFAIRTAPSGQVVNHIDGVAVIDGLVTVTNLTQTLPTEVPAHDPVIFICDDVPTSLSSSSTWTPISIPLTHYTENNVVDGRVHKLINGTYIVGFHGNDTSSNEENGVLISSSLTDWSAMTRVVIGPSGTNRYTEINIEELPGGTLRAHLRTEASSPLSHYSSVSTDHGATWSAPAAAFQAHGDPMFRVRPTGLMLTIYRQITNEDTYWRQSVDDGTTWSAETLLDGQLIGGHPSTSIYATLLPLDATHDLAVYGIIDASFVAPANLYSQVFTDSSTH